MESKRDIAFGSSKSSLQVARSLLGLTLLTILMEASPNGDALPFAQPCRWNQISALSVSALSALAGSGSKFEMKPSYD